MRVVGRHSVFLVDVQPRDGTRLFEPDFEQLVEQRVDAGAAKEGNLNSATWRILHLKMQCVQIYGCFYRVQIPSEPDERDERSNYEMGRQTQDRQYQTNGIACNIKSNKILSGIRIKQMNNVYLPGIRPK